MVIRLSETDLSKFEQFSGRPIHEKPKRNKYNAQRTEVDGIKFDSKAEAKRYKELSIAARAGQCWFIRQPSFDLPGGSLYRADFLVYWRDKKDLVIEDVKGIDTPVSRLKRKQLKALYGVDVVLVRSERRK